MAKFFGMIGFAVGTREGTGEEEGITKELPIIEKQYYGDIIEYNRRFEKGTDIEDDIRVDCKISIVADDYARHNIYSMKYVVLDGISWKVESVKPGYPRLTINIGGVYNGPTPRST